ncbi:DEAD/DEAH box helicase [Hyphomicrobium sp.]|uniref:DEAD/DEAH box helicase n=1 Tax=Hyphomicrobium sp. TaxID=82 RepID=UPI003563633B
METKTFADLGLSPKVQVAITAAGYTIPTPIQAAAIPVAVTGRDVLGIAQTGTGKTASFVLPMITRLESGRARARMPRSLILAPTRELAAQVAQSFEKYGINHKLSVALLIGGVSMDDQVKKLDRGVDVLIATPGRLLDHFGRGRVMLMGVEILVIDEADRMLDMGFIPDIEKICKLLPPRRQTLFFSATMPPEITRLVNQFLNNPERIEVAKPATTAKTITQRFVYCSNGEDWAKREVLRDLIRDGNVKNAIIFCNRKRDVAVLFKSLAKHGFNAGALHGDMDQSSRTETLDKFRKGEIMLLAASDVAARGLDIPEVSHVFNFDLPWAADDYVHRIGRTGRAGHEGHSISLVSPDDLKFVKDIEKVTAETAVWLGDPPSEDDIAGAGKRRRGRGGQTRGAAPEKSGRPARGGSRSGHREPRPASERPQGERPAERTAEPRTERPKAQPPAREQDRVPAPVRAEQPADRPARNSEQRADQPRRERQPHREQAKRERAPSDQPTVDAWTDEPKAPRRSERTPEKRQAAQEQPRKSAPPQKAPAPQKGGDRLGFAENIPAFMRKPPRPMKVPGRG